ncbi:MAG: hypothetical protein N4A49_13405 [Marinifilaceae bacterium]|jgi:hypothetical protein|nr:hypothetical protein [Marinifilaceae bacterium]
MEQDQENQQQQIIQQNQQGPINQVIPQGQVNVGNHQLVLVEDLRVISNREYDDLQVILEHFFGLTDLQPTQIENNISHFNLNYNSYLYIMHIADKICANVLNKENILINQNRPLSNSQLSLLENIKNNRENYDLISYICTDNNETNQKERLNRIIDEYSDIINECIDIPELEDQDIYEYMLNKSIEMIKRLQQGENFEFITDETNIITDILNKKTQEEFYFKENEEHKNDFLINTDDFVKFINYLFWIHFYKGIKKWSEEYNN